MSYKLCSICLKCISACVFLLIFQTAVAQDLGGLDAIIDKRQKEYKGKLAVMVWKDTVLYQKYTGDLAANTQMNMGYASAWFTAALAMSFVDQGKISLDDPVTKYLPIFGKYAKSYLTIRHCLANTTGLSGDKAGMEKLFAKNKFETLEEMVNSYASSREIVNNPGEAFSYNAIGTNIVGRVLEVVGKKSFDRLMADKIFRPLKMKRSTFTSDRVVNPAMGALSTANDYIIFLSMLLNKGTLNGKQILTEASVAELQKIQTGQAKIVSVPPLLQGYAYGLGNWIGEGGHLFTSPGLPGGWPYINTQKKYAAVVFGETKEKEENKELYSEVMELLESGL